MTPQSSAEARDNSVRHKGEESVFQQVAHKFGISKNAYKKDSVEDSRDRRLGPRGHHQKSTYSDKDCGHRSASHQLDEGSACSEQCSACRHPGKADLPRRELHCLPYLADARFVVQHFLPQPVEAHLIVQRFLLDALMLRQHQVDVRQFFAQVDSANIVDSHLHNLSGADGQRDGDDVRRLHLSTLYHNTDHWPMLVKEDCHAKPRQQT